MFLITTVTMMFSYINVMGIWQNVLNCGENNITEQNRNVLKDRLS